MEGAAIATDLAEAARTAAAERLGARPADVVLELLDTRRSVRPVFRASIGERELIVKQYLDAGFLDGAAARLAAAAGLRPRVEVAELLGVDRERLLLLMSVVRGTPLLARLADPIGDPGSASARAGATIAILHGSGIALPERMTRREMIDSSRRMVAKYARASREHALASDDPALGRIAEEDAARTDAGFALVERLVAGLPDDPLVPTHGDFGPGQLLDDGARLAILDFDRAVVAEAARDLGYYVAHLLRDLPEQAEVLAGRFLAGYGAETALPARPVIDAYTLVVLLRKLARATRPPSALPSWGAEQAAERVRATGRLRPAIDRLIERGEVAG